MDELIAHRHFYDLLFFYSCPEYFCITRSTYRLVSMLSMDIVAGCVDYMDLNRRYHDLKKVQESMNVGRKP